LKLQSINCFLLGLPNWQVHVFWIKVETGVNIANLWPVMIIQEIDSSCFVHLKVQVEHSSSQDSRCGSCHGDDAKCCYSKKDKSGCVMTLSMQLLPCTAIGIAHALVADHTSLTTSTSYCCCYCCYCNDPFCLTRQWRQTPWM